MVDYEHKILHALLEKYEKSKSFLGDNKVQQRFGIKIDKSFPAYGDHSNFDVFQEINETINHLKSKGFVMANNKGKVYDHVYLNIAEVEAIYLYIGRIPKKERTQEILEILNRYNQQNEVLRSYGEAQYKRLSENKSVQWCNEDLKEFENVLLAAAEVFQVETEMYVRDFSIKVFKDSKIFENIAPKLTSLLFEYGEFAEKEHVLDDLNIIKNPTYVNFKGSAILTINGQLLDLSQLGGDIALSSKIISSIEKIEVLGDGILTVENLTSFHTINDPNRLMIYLGGFHNQARRQFIRKIYEQNSTKKFEHFGDIDAGGFYILKHLREKTGVDFKPYCMDIETLKEYQNYTKQLTENDQKRLRALLESPYREVVLFMLENDCKLEQEAVNQK